MAQRLGLAHGKQPELFIPVLQSICMYCVGLYLLQPKCHCMHQVFLSHLLNLIKFQETRGYNLNIFLRNAYTSRRRTFAKRIAVMFKALLLSFPRSAFYAVLTKTPISGKSKDDTKSSQRIWNQCNQPHWSLLFYKEQCSVLRHL